jgi:predicted SAM-dependent methyltransferase
MKPKPSMVQRWRALAKRQMSDGLRQALLQVGQEWRLQRQHRASVKRARRLATAGSSLRLNLGSGFRPRQAPGWINVDLSCDADLQLDLREPLPFPDNSVAEIYTEHFVEHLNYPNQDEPTSWSVEAPGRRSEVLSLLRECRRVLRPGGVFDVVVPDAEGIVMEYAARREHPFPWSQWWGPKWCDTPMHVVNYVFRQGREHKYAYDEETLRAVLRAAGFEDVSRRPFNPATDAENHQIGSLCMVGRKPSQPSRLDDTAVPKDMNYPAA